MSTDANRITKIGIFYDGNFFRHVSNYYRNTHPRRARISIAGLHEFVRAEVARSEQVDRRTCQIVDRHYFRGRLSAVDAASRQVLLSERPWDQVLMNEAVVTHYLPLSPRAGNRFKETGVDVALALEAFHLSVLKGFDVVVLVTGDGDYLPLVRKLNGLGTRVMLLGWEVTQVDAANNECTTCVSARLMAEVNYPISMHLIIDERGRRGDPLVNALFVPRFERPTVPFGPDAATVVPSPLEYARPSGVLNASSAIPVREGVILSLKDTYGFLRVKGVSVNVLFPYGELRDAVSRDLTPGQHVACRLEHARRGWIARDVRVEARDEVGAASSAA